MSPNRPELPNRQSIRLQEFDYSQPGGYFITINTYGRQKLLSRIENGVILLSPIGEIVEKEWLKLPYRFKSVEVDQYSIMPDHFHGTLLIHPGENEGREQRESFSHPVKGSLSTIIRSFKASVTVRAHVFYGKRLEIWQRNYYEEVIEDEEKLDRIREYILANPYQWIETGTGDGNR